VCKQKLIGLFILVIGLITTPSNAEDFFPTFADSNTVALWLFDETAYNYATLIDAGEYEYDLQLMDGGDLVPGKFGNALSVSSGYGVAYAGFAGSAVFFEMREEDETPSGLWSPTIAPEKLLNAFVSENWTIEFWLNLSSASGEAVIFDLGDIYKPGFTLSLSGSNFIIADAYDGIEAECQTNTGELTDGRWHHVAFTRSGSTVNHFVDGQLLCSVTVSSIAAEPVPPTIMPPSLQTSDYGFKNMDFEGRRQNRFNLAVGQDRHAGKTMNGKIDELRVSDIIRYSGNFAPPDSFSRNYRAGAPGPAVANGPSLLLPGSGIAGYPPPSVLEFGARKHVFIDDALLDTKQNITVKMNAPTDMENLNFTPALLDKHGPYERIWRPSVFDANDKVCMFINDSYESHEGIIRLRTSEDGVNFDTPNWGIYGDTEYIFKGTPSYGCAFRDLNPNINPEEQYKYSAWVANRGIVLYLSPDGVHWRRNETMMLPLITGGGCETYWDDQRGLYANITKRDGSWRSDGRTGMYAQTKEVLKTWPFNKLADPYFEGWPSPCITKELKVLFPRTSYGGCYRSRAIKYPWAPDAHVAFIWRFKSDDETRRIELAVSRDGLNWKFYTDQGWYYAPYGSYKEVISLYGLIRRGDEIWQYAEYGLGEHSTGEGHYKRVVQRLDGFVSLNAGSATGTAVTRPLIYDGNRIEVNADVSGSLRVALLNQAGDPISGFDISDCDAVVGDSTGHIVTWAGKSNISRLAGDVVRIKFEMQNAKLYAFEIIRNPGSPADINQDGIVNFLDFAMVVEDLP